MHALIPRPLHRLALRVAHRLRHQWRRLAKPDLRGVSIILRDPQGRVLFVRHAYGPRDWGLPGGGIARGEEPADAARREAQEELGYVLGDLQSLGTLHETIAGAPHTAFLFLAEVGSPPQPDRREIVDARFARPGAPPQPLSAAARRRLAQLETVER